MTGRCAITADAWCVGGLGGGGRAPRWGAVAAVTGGGLGGGGSTGGGSGPGGPTTGFSCEYHEVKYHNNAWMRCLVFVLSTDPLDS